MSEGLAMRGRLLPPLFLFGVFDSHEVSVADGTQPQLSSCVCCAGGGIL